MALTESKILPLGTEAPRFFLQDTVSGNYMSLDDLKSDKATVIMFICNHCPYVIHINRGLVDLANEYKRKGVSFIAISSNDVEHYPDDDPDKMRLVAKILKYPFPYLYDKRQEVAKAYDAACTPDFYVFNGDMKLTYRGRMDDSTPGNGKPVTGDELRNAINSTLEDQPIENQIPSMGCGIKWKS
ncbi:MAG: thioredoxin family protein [Saprospiraceae bacterium]|nr:thioredoxin family protein [Saprospiraceae bacterium]